MRSRLILTLACAGLITGCARHYDVLLSNGLRVTTSSKPKLKDGYYAFKDAKGQEIQVSAARVNLIEPHQNTPEFYNGAK